MWFASVLAVCTLVYWSSAVEETHSISKRSLWQFHKSIQCIINRGHKEPSFKNYGCHCRPDSGGKHVDALDKCCKKRSKCIKKLLKSRDSRLGHRCNDRDVEGEVYSVVFTCHAGTMDCGDSKGTCWRRKCDCDKAAMTCLRKKIKKHKQKFENYDKRLC